MNSHVYVLTHKNILDTLLSTQISTNKTHAKRKNKQVKLFSLKLFFTVLKYILRIDGGFVIYSIII